MEFELQIWSESHRLAFAEMQRDTEVMADLGGPYDDSESNEKFDRYRDAWVYDGISRWAVVDTGNIFLGYAGVMKRTDLDHPIGVHYEIGWRFCRKVWGKGLATLSDVMERPSAQPWSIDDAPRDYLDMMLKGIVGIRFTIEKIDAKYKLDQNKKVQDRMGAAEGLRGTFTDKPDIAVTRLQTNDGDAILGLILDDLARHQ